MLNSSFAIVSRERLIVCVDITETFNAHTGDVDQKQECRFFNHDGVDIGIANIYINGDHTKITGDFNGKKLVEKFQLI